MSLTVVVCVQSFPPRVLYSSSRFSDSGRTRTDKSLRSNSSRDICASTSWPRPSTEHCSPFELTERSARHLVQPEAPQERRNVACPVSPRRRWEPAQLHTTQDRDR